MGKNRSPGEGSIYRDQRGFWRGAVTMPDGKRRYLSGKTRAEVAAKVADTTSAARKGLATMDASATLATYMAEWLEGMRAVVSERVWRSYDSAIRRHILPELGRLRLADITTARVSAMMAAATARGLRPGSVARVRIILRGALEHAVRDGLLQRNPVTHAPPPRAEHQPQRWLDAEGARRFLAAAALDRDGCMLSILLLLGMRAGEAQGLRWSDYSEGRGIVEIRRTIYRRGGTWREGRPKTASSRRALPLPPAAIALLAAERERQQALGTWAPEAPLIQDPKGRVYGMFRLRAALARVLAAAGLPTMRLHDLRHSTASVLLESGVPARVVADLLGHSTVAVTLAIYSHVTPRMVDNAVAVLGALAPPVAAQPAAPPPPTTNDNPHAERIADPSPPASTSSMKGDQAGAAS